MSIAVFLGTTGKVQETRQAFSASRCQERLPRNGSGQAAVQPRHHGFSKEKVMNSSSSLCRFAPMPGDVAYVRRGRRAIKALARAMGLPPLALLRSAGYCLPGDFLRANGVINPEDFKECRPIVRFPIAVDDAAAQERRLLASARGFTIGPARDLD